MPFISFLSSVPSFAYTLIIFVFTWFIASWISDIYAEYRSTRGEAKVNFEYVGEVAKQVVRVGQENYSEMIESVEDAALYSGVSSNDAAKILDQEIRALKVEQVSWRKPTEVNRLNAAFLELETLGYHTGGGLVDDPAYEVSKARKVDKAAKKRGDDRLPGYVFYSIDGVEEALVNNHPIYFWYGTTRRKTNVEENLRVVSDLNSALLAQGLKPHWDGTLRMQLSLPIKWQVRWDEARGKTT